MSGQWTVPAWLIVTVAAAAAVLLVVAVVAAVALVRVARRTTGLQRRLEALEALEAHQDRRDVEPLPVPADEGTDAPSPYVITRLGEAVPEVSAVEAAPVLPPGQFADVLLRESVVQSASLLHGLRRALSPEVRSRIRFEMKREVKRARKTRRAEQREALREWQARQRAAQTDVDESAA